MSISHSIAIRKTTPQNNTTSPKKRSRKRKPAQLAPRRYILDIGKNICLALMAEKYDFDPRIDGNQRNDESGAL